MSKNSTPDPNTCPRSKPHSEPKTSNTKPATGKLPGDEERVPAHKGFALVGVVRRLPVVNERPSLEKEGVDGAPCTNMRVCFL